MKVVFLDRRSLWVSFVVSLGVILCCLLTYSGSIAVSSSAEAGVKMPILMYHSILQSPQTAGQYVLTCAELENDLRWLRDNGYESVVVGDLLAYVYQGTPLPAKPVMITFDDGHLNNLLYVLPLLEKYDMRAVFSVVGEFSDRYTAAPDRNANYAVMTWEDIKIAVASGRVEIQNHSYNMHQQGERMGASKVSGESVEEYESVLLSDIALLQKKLEAACGILPTAFAYPFGFISPVSDNIVKKSGLLATLTCYEHMNYITRDPDCLFSLGRYNRPAGISTESFMKKILK